MPIEIRTYGASVLRRTADPITKIDSETKQIAEKMVEAMLRANGIGIAAHRSVSPSGSSSLTSMGSFMF